jgi:hypothetical protein
VDSAISSLKPRVHPGHLATDNLEVGINAGILLHISNIIIPILSARHGTPKTPKTDLKLRKCRRMTEIWQDDVNIGQN